MISHIMLNLRTHLQESRVVTFGIHDKWAPGMGSSQIPSPGMASRPMGVTTIMALTLTLMTIDPHTRAPVNAQPDFGTIGNADDEDCRRVRWRI